MGNIKAIRSSFVTKKRQQMRDAVAAGTAHFHLVRWRPGCHEWVFRDGTQRSAMCGTERCVRLGEP